MYPFIFIFGPTSLNICKCSSLFTCVTQQVGCNLLEIRGMLHDMWRVGAPKQMLPEELKGGKCEFHFFLACHSTRAKINYETERL